MKNPITTLLLYFCMAAMTVIMVGPFLWMLLTALRGEGEVFSLEVQWTQLTLRHMNQAMFDPSIALYRYFFNSFVVSTMAIFLNLLLSSLAAYPLARYLFPGRQVIFFIILATMMIPFQLLMIPLYHVCLRLNLQDSFLGVVLPFSVSAFGIFLLRAAYSQLPVDLEHSARIDGAGEFRIWAQIMTPLIKPAMATLTIFVFIAAWSDFLWPLIILNDPNKFTLPVGLARLLESLSSNWRLFCAASTLSIIPTTVLFFFCQRFFLAGALAGAVKE
jgi:putative chitobiose transport system permease protein